MRTNFLWGFFLLISYCSQKAKRKDWTFLITFGNLSESVGSTSMVVPSLKGLMLHIVIPQGLPAVSCRQFPPPLSTPPSCSSSKEIHTIQSGPNFIPNLLYLNVVATIFL
jgi:hypothetical protein